MNLRLLSFPLIVAAVALAANAAVAATSVNVQLTDTGLDTGMATGLTYATPGVDMSKATGAVKLSRTSAPKGDVTFTVSNGSKELVHEMLVVRLSDPQKPLPLASDQAAIDEAKINSLGEVSELDPGKIGTVTVNLQPGTYLLLCNVPGHFEAGMWATFTVTG
jgi:uncharacterized cupredoxin-like copper-binding protein